MTETAPLEALRARLADGRAAVGVAGLGYVGLPLAVELARAGFRITGSTPTPSGSGRSPGARATSRPSPPAPWPSWCTAGRLQATSGWDVAAALDAIVICVPTPLTPNREPDLSFVRAAARRWPAGCGPASSSCSRARPTPGRRRSPAAPPRGRRAPGGPGLRPRLLPRARGSGQPRLPRGQHPEAGGRGHPACTALAQALYEKAVVKVVPVSSPAGRRDGQAPREHLPQRQHRARQRAGDALRPDGRRRLGGRRGRGHQAVRLHELPAGTRRRRALHPRRPGLSGLEGEGVRLLHELHHAGGRGQREHAVLRRGEALAAPRPARRGRPRRAGCSCSA